MPNFGPLSGLSGLLQGSPPPTQPQGLTGLLSFPGGALPPATANQSMMSQAMRARGMMPNNDPSWYREDGSKKGSGFMGLLPSADGRTSTELSIGVNIGGKEVQIPSLVPTLSPQEIMHLLNGGQMTDSIVQKAVSHARTRMQQGLSPFAD